MVLSQSLIQIFEVCNISLAEAIGTQFFPQLYMNSIPKKYLWILYFYFNESISQLTVYFWLSNVYNFVYFKINCKWTVEHIFLGQYVQQLAVRQREMECYSLSHKSRQQMSMDIVTIIRILVTISKFSLILKTSSQTLSQIFCIATPLFHPFFDECFQIG